MDKETPDLDWQWNAEAFVHPLKLAILREMADGKPRASSDIVRAVDAKLGDVSFHMRRLEKAGMVDSAGTEARPGRHGMVRLYRMRSEND